MELTTLRSDGLASLPLVSGGLTMIHAALPSRIANQYLCSGGSLRQAGIDQFYVQGREGKWPEAHVGEVPGGPTRLHDSGGRVPADALQNMSDLVNHYMG